MKWLRRGGVEVCPRGAGRRRPDSRAGEPATLRRHDLPRVPAGGQIWERFPIPLPLSGQLAEDLYRACGLSSFQIELLTGQPSQTVRRILRDAGVTLRPPGGRSPFLRRCRDRLTC